MVQTSKVTPCSVVRIMKYYVRWRGQVHGPYSGDAIRDMWREGRLTRYHELSSDEVRWSLIGETADFGDLTAGWSCVENHPHSDRVTESPQRMAGSDADRRDEPRLRVRLPEHDDAPSPEPSPSNDLWFYAVGMDVRGPVSRATIETMVRDGGVPGTAMVCASDDSGREPEWVPIATWTNLGTGVRPVSSAATPEETARSPFSTATASLWLGVGAFFPGLVVPGVPLAVAAVITGHMARRDVRLRGAGAGRGRALAGLLLGYAAIGLAAALGITWLALRQGSREDEGGAASVRGGTGTQDVARLGAAPRALPDDLRRRTPSGSGTGFFITNDGYLLTAAHVVCGAKSVRLLAADGKTVDAAIVFRDSTNDIAVLKAEGSFTALPIAQGEDVLSLGTPVFTIGFPNVPVQGTSPKFTRGEISSLAGIRDDPRYYQISVPIQPGNSGGALVGGDGKVVGIITARLADDAAYDASGLLPQNVSYALKISHVFRVLEGVPELRGKIVPHGNRKVQSQGDAMAATQRATCLILTYATTAHSTRNKDRVGIVVTSYVKYRSERERGRRFHQKRLAVLLLFLAAI